MEWVRGERRPEGRRRVAVGTAVTRCPPHRPVLALLTHTVPTSHVSVGARVRMRQQLPIHPCARTRTRQATRPTFPGSVSGAGFPAACSPWSAAFPPRSPAALPGLRSTASLVLHRCTTPRRRASGPYSSSPSPSGPCPTDHGQLRGLSVLARGVSMHAWGLQLRKACDALAN